MIRTSAIGALVACALGAGCEGIGMRSTVAARAASDLECDASEVVVEPISEVDAFTFRAAGCGKTNVYTCIPTRVSGYCVSDNASPRPLAAPSASGGFGSPPAAAATGLLGVAPAGAGGFTFSSSPEETRSVCEQSGHGYVKGAGAFDVCDGLPTSVGTPARAELRYCASKLCAVALSIDVASNASLSKSLMRWKGALVDRYGAQTTSRVEIPPACADDLTPCLIDGTAHVAFEWRWPTRQHIVVSAGLDESQRQRVKVTYDSGWSASAPGL